MDVKWYLIVIVIFKLKHLSSLSVQLLMLGSIFHLIINVFVFSHEYKTEK